MIRTANGTGNLSSATLWEQATNTPTIHASTSLTISTSGITSATFTAPNTTNKSTGVWVYLQARPTGTLTATLQENSVNTSATATIANADIVSSTITSTPGWVYFKWATPYTFTTTSAGAYRIQLKTSVSLSSGAAADSGGLNFAYIHTDDRTGALGSTDNIWIPTPNCTSAYTVTVDGTSNVIGDGVDTGTITVRGLGLAIHIGSGSNLSTATSILKWDTSASAAITVLGHVVAACGGEIQIGTQATPYPSANQATLTFNENGTTTNYGLQVRAGGRFQMNGAPKSSTSLWKTNYVSGTGIPGDPFIFSDSVNWDVGDEVLIGPTGNSATNYNEGENKNILVKNSATSYETAGANVVVNGNMETSGSPLGSWTATTTNGSVTQDNTQAHSGTYSANLTRTTGSTNIVQSFTVLPNTSYELRFWVLDNGTNGAQYRVRDVTHANANIIATTTATAGATWHEVTASFTTPAGTTTIDLTLFSPAVNATNAWIDDVQIRQGKSLYFTKSSDAVVLNLTRNILITTTNTSHAWYMLNSTPAAGDFYAKWVRFETVGGSTSSREGIRLLHSTGVIATCDYCVAYRPIYRGFYFVTSKVQQTFTGLIACNQNSASTVGVLALSGASNKQFNDCYIIKNNRMGVELSSTFNANFTNCQMIANNTAGSGSPTATGGITSGTAGQYIFDGCEIHCNRVMGISLNGTSNGTVFKDCNIGTKGNNGIDVNILADTANDALFDNSSFGSTTLLNNYLAILPGSEIKFKDFNATLKKHYWYTAFGSAQSTGTGLSDTNVRTMNSLGLRLTPEDGTDGFTWSFHIPSKAQSITNFFGWFQLNAAFTGDASSSATVEMYLPGSTTPDATYSLSKATNNWQAAVLSAVNTATVDGLAEIRVVGITATVGAYVYIDDLYNAGDTVTSSDKVTGLDTWYNGKPIDIIQPSATSAADIWTFPTSDLTTSGTTGKQLKDALTTGKFLGLK